GLTIDKQLVEMHGGAVDAYSEGLGEGSEFVIRLPLCGTQPDSTTEEDSSSQLAGSSGQLRILVVDDNQDAANTLSQILKIMGNDVFTAYDGLAGVETADAARPDLILL